MIKSDSEGLPVSASTQPTMMAVMLSQLGLAAGHRVLEIGTGTGYNAALIARIVGDQKSVVTIDVVPDLIGQARVNLTAAGYGRVTVVCGDGAAGVPDHAPYDRIIVTTGTWDLATQWWAQLGPAGRIVLAKYLARQAIVWHELGRPGAQDLELSAWPPGARPETIGGASIVIDRPHVRLAVRWPTL